MDIDKLNQELYDACTINGSPSYAFIEELLKNGAQPMGRLIEYGEEYTNLYEAVLACCVGCSEDNYEERIPIITKLFLEYGMDVDSPSIPYKKYEMLHPIWHLAHFDSGKLLRQTLELLLDAGTSGKTIVNEFVWHALEDWDMIISQDSVLQKDGWGYKFFCEVYIKSILFCASYSDALEELKDELWYSENDFDVQEFRNMDNFDVTIKKVNSKKGKCDWIDVVDNNTGHIVWSYGYCMKPEDLLDAGK